VFLHPGVDVGEGAHRTRNGAGRHFLPRHHQALARALELGIGLGQLDAEGGGLGMDAVAAADADGVPVLEGAALQRGEEAVHILDQQVGGAGELHVEAGVEHVGGGHALVHETRLGPHDLRQMGQEGDHVMLGDGLDLVDAGDVEARVLALFPDLAAASFGTTPSSASASVACASISNQMRKRVSGSQMWAISLRV
jgi:hypothetical protein